MRLSRATYCLLLLFSFASFAAAQGTLTSRQLELYGGLARLPFPTLNASQTFGQTSSDTTLNYFIDADPEQAHFFGFGYRRDWDNGRYVHFSVPRLALGSRRTQDLGRLLSEPRLVQQRFDYLAVRGEFGKRYYTQYPVSFLLGFGLEGVWTQTKNAPDPTANSYFSRYRLLGSQLVVTAQAQWRMGERWTLIAGIDPLAISLAIETRYAENPDLDQDFWTTTNFDLDFINSNQLFLGLGYRWE
jgi:hypothetical protein